MDKMKRRRTFIFLVLIALMLPFTSFSQVDFMEVVTEADMEAARKKANDGMLLLFVDVYATWCGPCKMMDAQVYPDPELSAYMNEHFVNVRMDGETDFGRKYAAGQQLQGYPSMFIFGDDGARITSVVGYKAATELLPILKSLVENSRILKTYRVKEENSTLSLEEYADYISLEREMGNQIKAERLAGEYIRKKLGEEELRDSDIRVVAYYTDLEDSWWPLFATDYERVKKVLGKEIVPVMETIYNNTLAKAIEQQNIVLISRMANELSPLLEPEVESRADLKTLPFIQYYYYTGQLEEMITYVDTRFAADRKDDHSWLFGVASQVVDMDQQTQNPVLLEKAGEWFAICIELDEQYDYYFYQGMVFLFMQKIDASRASFELALELAKSDEQRKMIDQVFKYINSQ